VPEQDRVEVPLAALPLNPMLAGDRVQVRPVEGDTIADSEIVLVKLLIPETVMVEGPAEPDKTLTLVGLAATVKSWTV